jgi:hypothetical protein
VDRNGVAGFIYGRWVMGFVTWGLAAVGVVAIAVCLATALMKTCKFFWNLDDERHRTLHRLKSLEEEVARLKSRRKR